MQTGSNPSNQPNQSNTNLQGNHTGLDKSQFSLSRPQVLNIVIVIGLILISLFILGVWAGEKRATKKQLLPKTQLTPTKTPPTFPLQTPTPFIVTPTLGGESSKDRPVEQKSDEQEPETTCRDRLDCIRCFGLYEICETGECINGVCVWPTSAPDSDFRKPAAPEMKRKE